MQRDTEKTVIKTTARVPATKGNKRKMLNGPSEEAYAVMKQLSSNLKKRDDFDVYGEYVAGILRNLKSKSVLAYAKYQINNALYRVKIADIPNTPESSSTPASDTPASTPLTQITTYTDTQSYNSPGSFIMPSATNTSTTSSMQTNTDTQSDAGAENMNENELTFTQILLDL